MPSTMMPPVAVSSAVSSSDRPAWARKAIRVRLPWTTTTLMAERITPQPSVAAKTIELKPSRTDLMASTVTSPRVPSRKLPRIVSGPTQNRRLVVTKARLTRPGSPSRRVRRSAHRPSACMPSSR